MSTSQDFSNAEHPRRPGRGLDELDADLTLAEAARNQAEINRAQAHQLAVAAHWADLHNADAIRPPLTSTGPSPTVRHGERLLCPGGDGSPGFAEFAPAGLAAALHVSPGTATALMADALDLRHRLPLLWARLQTGEVKAWAARHAAAASRDLSTEAATRVDAKLATVADTVTGGRFRTLVKAAVAAADPAQAAQQAKQATAEQGVWLNPETDHGLGTLFARAAAHDLAAFDEALDIVSRALKTLGDPDGPDTRRAKAIGILADPQTALDLVDRAEQAKKAASQAAAARRTGTPDPALDDQAERLRRFGFGTAVLYLHIAQQVLDAVTRGAPSPDRNADAALTRVEDIGPVLLDQVRSWLDHRNVIVKPVIDLPNLPGIDGYEIPGWLTEAVHLRTPADCSPYSTNLTRRKDIDHTTPYQPPDRGGGGGSPPEQTRLDNLGPLTRHNHRRKTFSGWQVVQPRTGVFVWRDPTGRHYLVDGHGTTALGKLWSG